MCLLKFFVSLRSGRFGLWLDGDLNQGRTQTCKTFANEPLSPDEDFWVRTLECWAFMWNETLDRRQCHLIAVPRSWSIVSPPPPPPLPLHTIVYIYLWNTFGMSFFLFVFVIIKFVALPPFTGDSTLEARQGLSKDSQGFSKIQGIDFEGFHVFPASFVKIHRDLIEFSKGSLGISRSLRIPRDSQGFRGIFKNLFTKDSSPSLKDS